MATLTPIARIAAWAVGREDRVIACRINRLYGLECPETVTLRKSYAQGHRGYCSPEHAEAGSSGLGDP